MQDYKNLKLKKPLYKTPHLLIRTGEDSRILDMMEKYGGGFVKSLAQTMRLADGGNFKKLREMFTDYWNEYKTFK